MIPLAGVARNFDEKLELDALVTPRGIDGGR